MVVIVIGSGNPPKMFEQFKLRNYSDLPRIMGSIEIGDPQVIHSFIPPRSQVHESYMEFQQFILQQPSKWEYFWITVFLP